MKLLSLRYLILSTWQYAMATNNHRQIFALQNQFQITQSEVTREASSMSIWMNPGWWTPLQRKPQAQIITRRTARSTKIVWPALCQGAFRAWIGNVIQWLICMSAQITILTREIFRLKKSPINVDLLNEGGAVTVTNSRHHNVLAQSNYSFAFRYFILVN